MSTVPPLPRPAAPKPQALQRAVGEQQRRLLHLLGILQAISSALSTAQWKCDLAPNLDAALEGAIGLCDSIMLELDPESLRRAAEQQS